MLRNFFRSSRTSAQRDPINPDAPVVVIGDVHGRADLLERILDRIGDLPIVCVGDYVDRGPDSANVLRMLHARPDITCLSGNHEEMMIDFIEAPTSTAGRRWLRYGGGDTLASFGITPLPPDSDADRLEYARNQLVTDMGRDMLRWLMVMPALWCSGNVAVVHAAADPNVSMDQQSMETLHWGHPDFHKKPRKDGFWVVHGHTIVTEPRAVDRRISIDTGAYATGRLTGVRIENGDAFSETVE